MDRDLESLLKMIKGKFADRRTELAEISLEETPSSVVVTGRVLDQGTKSTVLQDLSAAQPGKAWVDQMQVMRVDHPQRMNVAVNLTGLYAHPSWLAEMLSQNTYGVQVEILEQKGDWVFVRQPDGYLGWMFRDYLSTHEPGVANHRVCVPMMLVHAQPDEASLVTARLPEAVKVIVNGASGDWMKIEPHPGQLPCGMPGGWAKKNDLEEMRELSLPPGEKRQVILRTAYDLLGVPYLWGGTTANGIDCSGLVQLCYLMAGVTLTRDADMQKAGGQPLQAPLQEGDLLFFCAEEDRSRVSHVAISLGGWRVIHSSRRRNGVAIDDVQEVPHLRETCIGACTYFKSGS